MTTRRLAAQTAAASAAGTALVALGPPPPGHTWIISTLAVRCADGSGFDAGAEARIYTGPVAIDTEFVEGTFSGGQDTTDTRIDLDPGEVITVAWTGATPGSSCTAIARGESYALQ